MSRVRANTVLFLIVFVWGATFLPVKNELEFIEPMSLVAWRFLIASIVLIAVFYRRFKKFSRFHLFSGMVIGLFLGLGYLVQTIGLQWTTSGKAGFLTGISVVIVPVFSFIFLKRRPSLRTWVGVLISAIGLGFLSLKEGFSISVGDLWVLGCAFAFAAQIVSTAYFVDEKRSLDPVLLAVIQVMTACAIAWVGALFLETPSAEMPVRTWMVIGFLGVVATAMIFCAQTVVQRFTAPTHVALIFALEPVFAGLIGWMFGGETMSGMEILGCVLILSGMLAADLSEA